MNGPIEKTSSTKAAANAAPTNVNHVLNRSKAMHLMNEDMARAHSVLRLEEAVRRERAHRLVVAHRAARRAEQASMRARRLLASVVVG